jgi:hypothetical protein
MGDLCVAKISLCCMFVVPCHLCVSYLRLCACHCHWYEICVLSSGMHTNTEFRMAASHKFPQYCSYPLLYFINHILFSLSASVCVVIHWKVGGLCWWYQSWRERWSFSQNQRLLGRYWLTFSCYSSYDPDILKWCWVAMCCVSNLFMALCYVLLISGA